MLDEAHWPALLDLAGRLGNEPRRYIFQHDRLQGEASLELTTLNE